MSTALAPLHFVHGRVDLHLEQSHQQLALSNDQLARFCGTSQGAIRNVMLRFPELESGGFTWLVTLDLSLCGVTGRDTTSAENERCGVTSSVTPHTRKSRARKTQTYRVWSFPEGCRKVAQKLKMTEQVEAFLDAISAYKDKQLELLQADVNREKSRNLQVEQYWFGRRELWPPIREGVIIYGLPPSGIAKRLGIKAAVVCNAIHRMIEVGILHPRLVAVAIENSRFSRRLRKSGILDRWGKPPVQADLFA